LKINGSLLHPGDYSKIGAYVQQDDILFDLLTPKELIEFAAKIRTTLDKDLIEKRVESIIDRLGL